MASPKPPDIILESLRGGYSDEVPPNALALDECTVANDVEWFFSTLGERRLGGQPMDLTSSGIAADAVVVCCVRHFPTKNEIDNELWVFSATVGTDVTINRRTSGGWVIVTPPFALVNTAPEVYNIRAVSFDGMLFICAKLQSGADRMLVWDGTSIRLAGLAEPAAPTAADTGSGTLSGTRYYRVRYVVQSGTTILRQSEPSPTVTFTPSGSGSGVLITKPASIGEGETNWQVEASFDDANFYIIATPPVGTTTYTDTNPATNPYSNIGELDITDIGENVPLPNARYPGVDDDRITLGGSFVNTDLDSRVMWTPVRNDQGFGNSERIPADTNNFRDLDSKEGGGLTGISSTANGTWYVFKNFHIYSMTRTGSAANAYSVITLSKVRGAIQGSMFSGMDEFGRACIYFLDEKQGPSRLGQSGLQRIRGLRTTWNRLNATAQQVIACGLYYPFKQQVWWLLSVDGANSPNLGIKLQVTELAEVEGDVKRGWSFITGKLPTALTCCLLTEQVTDEFGRNSLSTRPILGYNKPDYLLRCDILDNDNGTPYVARIRTRPLFSVGLLNRWGAMTAALLAAANATARVQVTFIRDYGVENNWIVTDLAPQSVENYVVKAFDNLVMSSSIGIQVEFGDVTDPTLKVGTMYHSQPLAPGTPPSAPPGS